MEGHYYTEAAENVSVNNILTHCKPQPAAAVVDHLPLQRTPPAHLQNRNPILLPSSDIINISIQAKSTASSHGRRPHNVTTPPYISSIDNHDFEKFPIDSCGVVLNGAGNEYYAAAAAMSAEWISRFGGGSTCQREDSYVISCMRRIAPEPRIVDGNLMASTGSPAIFHMHHRAQYLRTKSTTCEIVSAAADQELHHVDTIFELPITTTAATGSSLHDVIDSSGSGWHSPSRRGGRPSLMNPHNIRDHSTVDVGVVENDDAYAPVKTKFMHMKNPRIFNHDSRSNNNNNNVDGNDAVQQQQELDAEDYFEALEGPELEVLRPKQVLLLGGGGEKIYGREGGGLGGSVRLDLPWSDKEAQLIMWPFLLRFPIGCFGICLGLGSQAILWKTLAEASSIRRLVRVPDIINLVLWCLSLLALLLVSTTYALKCVFYAKAVRREFCHPVRVNFFFAPCLASMFLALAFPRTIASSPPHPSLSFLFMAPLFALQLKLYGQWLSGGEKRLSRVANPSTHLSLVGNFVGSLLATSSGLSELALFFWAVGLAHYLVLFVTLYQRLPSATSLPKELHPVLFLFIAVPSCACLAWSQMVGDFDLLAKLFYFVGLFLFASLIVRVNLFRGLRFSIAWWAYTTPMTALSIATINYSLKVTHPVTQGMAVVLSLISAVTVLSVWVLTMLHAFFWRTLFPNDVAIAISVNNGVKKERRKI